MSAGPKHEEIREFIISLNPAAQNGVDFAANLLDEGIVNSVAMMDLVVWLEQNYQITIDNEDLVPENFGSIDAMVAYVERCNR